jgi:pimeloyl-ACP methyl ester carboxylesterase
VPWQASLESSSAARRVEHAGNHQPSATRARGNLDNWDPALIDALAARGRRVVTFDAAGVGGSTGTTPATIEQMARDAIAFLAAMEFAQADLLGFSIGSSACRCSWPTATATR